MTSSEITLETAAFLDSPQARELAEPPAAYVRAIAERFLRCCYDDLGKAPRFLDGHDVHDVLGHRLPSHFGKKDPLAAHVLPVLRALFEFLEQRHVVSQAFEMRRALEETAAEFAAAVRTGEIAAHAPAPPVKPIVHKAPKVGRNDPCPCGSGKKWKQCCQKLGR